MVKNKGWLCEWMKKAKKKIMRKKIWGKGKRRKTSSQLSFSQIESTKRGMKATLNLHTSRKVPQVFALSQAFKQ